MFNVRLFFVPWENPENVIEIETERDKLEDIDVYNIPMFDAAKLVVDSLETNTIYQMLRVVREGENVIQEMETELLETRDSDNGIILKHPMDNLSKALGIMETVAEALMGLE